MNARPALSRAARRGRALLALTVVIAAAALVFVFQALSAANGTTTLPPLAGAETDTASQPGSTGEPTAADGRLGDAHPSVFDDESPAVANLDPALLEALRSAASDAADEGIELRVNSGWRTPEYQQWLLDNAVAEYGSSEEAARWVATPQTSAHVTGDAVDLGGDDALDWLVQHGDDYGLCQIYANERWHYELRPDAEAHGCPQMYADPTDDPRMQS
ncbi:M15 family metallopeptidase [Microbacterium sp. CIAB417]|uniref:M15 family metallopeptidase n=1 Tax=Microbacterium sp. CIAB417 TaxID=2860287 RepID=UPI001FABF1E9|nr:M15 family metallopeptidase [Microbacterium sp. CIAB417]